MHDSADGPQRTAEQFQQALAAVEARFRNIIERNADGMIVVSREGAIRFANPAAQALMGRELEALVGQMFGIPIIPGETTEVDIPSAGGPARIAEMRAVETAWDGEPVFLASLHDITQRKQLEEELRRRAQELADADRRKNEFLAMLSHELRNPLAPIMIAMKIMRLRPDDPAAQERMREMVERQVRLLTRLIDDLLDVSRIAGGKVQLRKEVIDLAVIVDRATEVALPLIEERRLACTVNLPGEPLWLDADPTRIEQVLINLLNNAAKYTDAGGSIRLSAERAGDEVLVRVRDTGIGIDPEMLPRVFDMFAQADHSLDRSQGGLGIGLTLVKSLVGLHGGTVQVHSQGLGTGSEFTVRLPLLPADTPHPAEPAPVRRAVSGQSLRVLVVDDNAAAAESLAALLRLWGHEPRVAFEGTAVAELAAAFQPHVVLLDIGLPGIDGYEVARRLRQQAQTRDALLVATSGYGGEDDRRRCREAGFHHHLIKPVDLDQLEDLLACTDSPARPGPASTTAPVSEPGNQ